MQNKKMIFTFAPTPSGGVVAPARGRPWLYSRQVGNNHAQVGELRLKFITESSC